MERKTIDEVLTERGLMARFYDKGSDAHIFVAGSRHIEIPASAYVRTFRIPEMRYGEVATLEEVRDAIGT